MIAGGERVTETDLPPYFAHPRREVVAAVPERCVRILDVGCGSGQVGRQLRRRRGCVVVGIERASGAARAAARHLDEVWIADAGTLGGAAAAPAGVARAPASGAVTAGPGSWVARFDCLIYADVLEHLRDPWGVLARQRAWLEPGGVVVVSLPNVGHLAVLAELLRGRFPYGDEGVLDRDHLRFFTLRGARELVEGAGFTVRAMHPVAGGRLARALTALSPVRAGALLARQVVLVADTNGGAAHAPALPALPDGSAAC